MNAPRRISFLQFRWAGAALTGMQTIVAIKTVRTAARYQLLDDLGWKPMWSCIVAPAISLFEKMRWDDELFDHCNAARRVCPATHGWSSAIGDIKKEDGHS